jgi:hypothetical protein
VPGAPAEAYAEDCPTYETISDEKLEPLITLMRCPNTTPRSSNNPINEIGSARAWLRGGLDSSLVETPNQLLRAVYVHLCARQLREEHKPYPAMAIGCTWNADRLDQNGLAKELAARPASQRSTLSKQAAADVREVRERVLAAFPKTKAAREWEIFYDLPTRVRSEAIARRNANAKAYQSLVDFDAAIQSGKFEGCAAPLRANLTTYLSGAKTMAAIESRITDPLGFALAEALARCHYYNEEPLQAGALLVFIEKARRQVTVAEQIYFAQLDALAVDAEKAEKFPNLVGTKYSSVHPTDLRPKEPWSTELDKKWLYSQSDLRRFQTREGRVAKLDKSKQGTVIHFQKERVPVVDVRCKETDRIDTITPEGKIKYREVCTRTPKGHTWSIPEPITVSEASGVKAGHFVRIGIDGDRGAVLTSADSPEPTRVVRVADIVLGG